MKNTKILALLLIVVFAFSLTLGVTAAQNDPTIAVELKSSTATQVIVNVVIKNNPGFDFCRTDVYYNADVLKFESYDLTGSIVPTSKVWNPNATKDKDGVPFINCSIASMMEVFEMVPYTRVSGDGVLVTLIFSVIPGASGEANVYATTKSDNFFMKSGNDYVYTEPVEKDGVTISVKNGEITGTTAPTEPSTPPTEPACTHDNKQDVVITAATCSNPGSKNVICASCGELVETNVTIPATGAHTEEVIPGKPATCGEGGLSDGKKCTVCGKITVEQVATEPTGAHSRVVVPGKPATCGEGGMSDGEKCSVCGLVIKEQTPTQPTGAHTAVIVPGKPATCGEAGISDGEKCSVCGFVIKEQAPTEPTGEHTEVRIPAEAATCEKPGMSAGSKCSVCDKIIVAPHETPLADHTPEVIPGKPASCGEAGLTEGEKCSVCGKIVKAQEEIPAISEHKYEIVSSIDSTCTVQGSVKSKCSVCGDEKTVPQELKPHTEVTIPAVDASCTATGLTAGVKCDVCGEIITAQEIVPALDHVYGEWVVEKEATCKEAGLKVATCVCGDSKSEEIPMTSHDYQSVVTAPECDKKGFTTHTCSICGDSYTDSEVAALEHAFNFVSENDIGKTYKCSICGETNFVPHEENPPTTDVVVNIAIFALVLMSASALVIVAGKKWTIG